MIGAVIFSNTVWTFWDVMLLFFVWIPLLMLWFFCMFDVFGRRDLSGWGKALWILAIFIFPWIGALAYLIFRPWEEDTGAYAPSPTYTGSANGQQSVKSEPKGPVPIG